MNFYIYASIFNLFASLICFIIICLGEKKTKAANFFLLFTFSVLIWSLFYALWISSNNYVAALWLSRLLNFAALFIPITFLDFCCTLLELRHVYKKIIKCGYICIVIFAPITLTPFFISSVKPTFNFLYWPQPGPLYILFLLEYMFFIGIAFIELYKRMVITKIKNEKRMLKFVFYGLVIGFLGGSTNFPLFYNIPIPPVGNILVAFYTFGVMYAVFRYNFMEVSIVLKRSVIYTILISLITLFYFVLIYIIQDIFKELIGYKSFLFSLISATVIAVIFIPLKNLIQNIVENFLFRGNFSQITEENELLRQEITQTDKLKAIATLASGLAHEIKNPLTTLRTFSEYVPQKKDDEEFIEKYKKIVPKELERIENLLNDLLHFAKPSPPELTEVNPSNLLENIVHLIEQNCSSKRITIETRLENQTNIKADPNQLQQAFLNIILNAIDAMPNGGTLKIQTEDNKHNYLIKISDTGSGISHEDLKHIFDPFFTKKEKGTGLGLAITQGIIEKHGGRISVESTINQGTTFIIKL